MLDIKANNIKSTPNPDTQLLRIQAVYILWFIKPCSPRCWAAAYYSATTCTLSAANCPETLVLRLSGFQCLHFVPTRSTAPQYHITSHRTIKSPFKLAPVNKAAETRVLLFRGLRGISNKDEIGFHCPKVRTNPWHARTQRVFEERGKALSRGTSTTQDHTSEDQQNPQGHQWGKAGGDLLPARQDTHSITQCSRFSSSAPLALLGAARGVPPANPTFWDAI